MKLLTGFNNAIESVRTNKVRTALTMLGVLIGVASIILLVSIGSGVQEQVSNEIKGLGADLVFVYPGNNKVKGARSAMGQTTNKITYNEVLSLEARDNMGLKVAPIMFTSLIVKNENKSHQSYVYGATPGYSEIANYKTSEGKIFTESQVVAQRRVCVIGKTVVDNLFKGRNAIGKNLSIEGGKFLVIGIFESKGKSMGEDNDDLVVVPITVAQTLFGRNTVDRIIIRAPSEDRVDETKRFVNRILRRHLNEEDFTIADQKDMLDMLNKIMGILTTALGGIAGISLIVGGIGIMNIMLVTVTERTREIGIRKAIGARESDILVQFIIESVVLSATGGIAGIIIGYAGAFLLSKFIPTSITLWSVLLAFGFSVFIGVFFGVYPASKAAKMDPIAALRYE